jgi:hypothetical protein
MGNFQGANNLGVGGGVIGLGGGQLGQFGNLGGQFGLQGGNQSQLLITLIRQIVGRPKDWALQYNPVTGQPLNPLDDQATEGLNQENNQLGFYPPAQALTVKGSSTIHTKPSNLITTTAPMGMGALPQERKDALAQNGQGRGNRVRVAGRGDERADPKDPERARRRLDPRTVWQDALSRGVDNPSLIIATADYLALNNQWEHAAEFLKADLRQGIVVEPWVYKALALALRQSNGSAEDIERAELSGVELLPGDAGSCLEAARALARDHNYQQALALCRQAALREPNDAASYAAALGYAELAGDGAAMRWAAGKLLSQDWPGHGQPLHNRAVQKLEALAVRCERQGQVQQAARLRALAARPRQRDLVIRLAWEGDADLDLRVQEPCGSVCSALQRQTVGGGTLSGDRLSEPGAEAYVAAEGFAGNYTVTVQRVWGRPLADKAQLTVIRGQGTPQESREVITVDLKSRQSPPLLVALTQGRRSEPAAVPAQSVALEEPPAATASENPDAVFHQLRLLSDPELAGYEAQGLRGGVATPGGAALSADRDRRPGPGGGEEERTVWQTKVKQFVTNSVDVTAQATISADRRYVRLSLTPVFNVVTGVKTIPGTVANPLIPGLPFHP